MTEEKIWEEEFEDWKRNNLELFTPPYDEIDGSLISRLSYLQACRKRQKEIENLWAVIRGMKKNMDIEANLRHKLQEEIEGLKAVVKHLSMALD